MRRQKNNPPSKGKEESPERVLNEIEVSKLSDTDFNTMVIRKLNELSENNNEQWEATRNLLRTISA